jgi:hypothetical protein
MARREAKQAVAFWPAHAGSHAFLAEISGYE